MEMIGLKSGGGKKPAQDLSFIRNGKITGDLPVKREGGKGDPRLGDADQDDLSPPVPGQLNHPADIVCDPDVVLLHQNVIAAVAENQKRGMVPIEPLGKPDEALVAQLAGHSPVDHQTLDLFRQKRGIIASLLRARPRREAVAEGQDFRPRKEGFETGGLLRTGGEGQNQKEAKPTGTFQFYFMEL